MTEPLEQTYDEWVDMLSQLSDDELGLWMLAVGAVIEAASATVSQSVRSA